MNILKKRWLSLLIGVGLLLPSLSLVAREHKVEVYLFYSPHCGHCIRLEKEFIPQLQEKYKDKIALRYMDITKEENLKALIALSKTYKVEHSAVPTVFVGNSCLVGVKDIENNLESLIDKYYGSRTSFPYLLPGVNLEEEFRHLSFFTIITAGLIDGINPCAFAVIVFFISFLTVYGYQKKEIVYVGSFYILSVFITYILIGVGLFGFLYSLRHFYFLMKLFYYFIAATCFLLAAFSLYDYFRFVRTGESEGMILQLPKFLKKKINLVIGGGLRKRQSRRVVELCLVAFGVGFSVSLLEAACTGQVYIPTIALILKIGTLRWKAFSYLVVYNIMFVLPLIVIFLLSLLGVNSQYFNRFLKKNLGKIKIFMFLLFLGLGVLILWLS